MQISQQQQSLGQNPFRAFPGRPASSPPRMVLEERVAQFQAGCEGRGRRQGGFEDIRTMARLVDAAQAGVSIEQDLHDFALATLQSAIERAVLARYVPVFVDKHRCTGVLWREALARAPLDIDLTAA